jgi:hypothetical protein
MEGVRVLHETIHEMHRRKHSGLILKIDFEKAYDRINFTIDSPNERLLTNLV